MHAELAGGFRAGASAHCPLPTACVQAGEIAAVQEAQSWEGSAAAWSRSLQRQHPLYADVLGPVALAVHEACHGLRLLEHAAQLLAGDPHLGPALCNLMSFAQPAAAGQLLELAAQQVLAACSKAHQFSTACSGVLLHSTKCSCFVLSASVSCNEA